VQLPFAFNHPARIAERIATLDLISDGRVEFGTGEASSEMELGGFGVERASKRAQWTEALDVVTRLMVEEPFAGHESASLSIPPRNVVPKPFQRPHPPLWVACSRRETIHLAATKGIGALSFSFIEPEEARVWVDDYYATLDSEECVPGGFSVNANVACVLPFMCHEDEATAIARGLDGGHFFGYSLAHYYAFGVHELGKTNVWDEFMEKRSQFGFDRATAAREGQVLGAKLLEQGLGALRGAIGTPDQIRDLIGRYESAGIDQLIFVSQAGRNRHEDICESMELFAREVMPEFASRADDADRAKEVALAGVKAAALARRAPPRRLDQPFAVPAVPAP
jgi:alkanesulfonate monooxygenase SsuD/methylene tetrahydromethanopterin reductase-like flavin-dependent oxidoreductase (luciferase family)